MELYKPNIIQFETKEQLYNKAEQYITEQLLDIAGELGTVRVCLSGGKTPLPLYKKLGENPNLPWESIEIFQSDERMVSQDSPDLNSRSILESFESQLKYIKRFNNFKTDIEPQLAVQNYNEILESIDEPFFDLSILGIGTDGHIASLFPGTTDLVKTNEKVILTEAPVSMVGKNRISLSSQTLLNSKSIVVLMTGSEKQDAFNELLEGSKSVLDFPSKILFAHPYVTMYVTFED